MARDADNPEHAVLTASTVAGGFGDADENSTILFDRVVTFEDGTNATMGALGRATGAPITITAVTNSAQQPDLARHALRHHLCG